MEISSWGITDVGIKRKQNQDSILLDPDLGLYIVADGMGGHKGGEVASAMACEVIHGYFKEELKNKNSISPQNLILNSIELACSKIYKHGNQEELSLKGMGTTVVMFFYHEETIYIGNVGDSRAYLFKKPDLWALTDDHSLVYEQVKEGLSAENLGKNVITRSVGFEREVVVDVFERKLDVGDQLLLCSDGLCGLVSDADIAKVLTKFDNPDVPNECVRIAHKAGGDDNISVIVLQIS